jgi:hypothetical protein
MFVLTVDQIDSRSTPDAVASTLLDLEQLAGTAFVLAPERTAGDEFQLLLGDGEAVLRVILWLTRTGGWSVGCGIGEVSVPLPRSIREATGDAFVAARTAVDRAKRKPTRVALESAIDAGAASRVEALLDLLLIVRARRTPEGWELFDLVETGLSQTAAASRLGISPQAASKRAQAAEIRAELAVTGVLATLVGELAG